MKIKSCTKLSQGIKFKFGKINKTIKATYGVKRISTALQALKFSHLNKLP